jgi:hypothetical protein
MSSGRDRWVVVVAARGRFEVPERGSTTMSSRSPGEDADGVI